MLSRIFLCHFTLQLSILSVIPEDMQAEYKARFLELTQKFKIYKAIILS